MGNIITFSPPINHKEGFGSIFQSEVFAFLYAMHEGKPFIRSKYNLYTGHNIDANENHHHSFFNFLNSRNIKLSNVNLENINFLKAYSIVSKLPSNKRETLISTLRSKYWKQNIKKSIDHNTYTIVLHIRNLSIGDVIHPGAKEVQSLESIDWQYFNYDYGFKNNNPIFYSKFYSGIINNILMKLPSDVNPIIKIFSTGKIEDFDLITRMINYKTELYLNRDVLSDFEEFVYSDCLIMAHSSLSYLASLLHLGPKYIRKGFRHFLTSDTIEINDFSVKGYGYMDKLIDDSTLFVKRFKFKLFFNNIKNLVLGACRSIIKKK